VLNPRRSPPRLAATIRSDKQNFCYPFGDENPDHTDVVCDDVVLLTLQYSSQWDSFAHVGSRFDADGDGKAELVFYNGFRAGEHVVPAPEKKAEGWERFEGTEARALGIQNMAEHGAQGRGVMIDLHHHFGRKREAVGFDALMKVLEVDKVKIEKGDMVCLYTGFADVLLEMKKKPDPKLVNETCCGLDGRDAKLLQWISDCGLAFLMADNYAVELITGSLTDPLPRKQPWLPLHEHCLFKNGIHLGEMFYLTELARWLRAHKRNRFLLTAPPLRLPGAVGSPATPIATV
jgi:kynurenine formamidase